MCRFRAPLKENKSEAFKISVYGAVLRNSGIHALRLLRPAPSLIPPFSRSQARVVQPHHSVG